jgi:iduronate 2-sulfatase
LFLTGCEKTHNEADGVNDGNVLSIELHNDNKGSDSAAVAQRKDHPNILIIIVDDLRPKVAAYGDQLARTPNIDELANTGVIFEQAFATVPNCGASRASLLSSKKPTANRFLSYDSRLDEDLPDALSLPSYFKANGYHTVSRGKVFDATMDSASGWSETPWNPEGNWTSSMAANERRDDIQRAYLDNPEGVVGPAFERLDVADNAYPDGKLADQLINDLRQLGQAEAPFLIAAGFRKPHLPFNAPERYWSLYDPNDLVLPPTFYSLPAGSPYHPLHKLIEIRSYTGTPQDGLPSKSQALNLIHAYLAAVSYADAQIGKVLDALHDLGLEDDTIVVLFGDNGMNLGDHSMWGKNTLFDITLRTPLIIRAPGHASIPVKSVASLLDIFPTLTDLVGLPRPAGLDGVSLAPLLNNPTEAVRTAAISRWFDSASVRTQRYRYTDWRNELGNIMARMLTDLDVDPDETRNVAEEAEYSKVVEELSALITADQSGGSWAPRVRDFVADRDGAQNSAK